ncbi:MAG: hypothetical protein FWH23_07940 [Bacteroidales bacterium]|nr:hypothetical protein [Bacteroidales bacterium]
MEVKIKNFGDSFGVQFPKYLLENVQISENDDMEILVKYNSIIIKRRENKTHFTTKERIAVFGDSIDKAQLSEIDWGRPQGKEIW